MSLPYLLFGLSKVKANFDSFQDSCFYNWEGAAFEDFDWF